MRERGTETEMTIRSPEVIQGQIQLALRAARERPGPAAGWAFACYSDYHPDGEKYGAVWWAQTAGGERMALTTQMLDALEQVEAGVWIWGQQIVTISTGPLQPDSPIVVDLVVHCLVLPMGVAATPNDHSEIRARLSAQEAIWSNPLVCVVRGPRPRSWPL